jgi:GNAT superfamily N-acetyltransferase
MRMSALLPVEIDPRNRLLMEQIGRLRVRAWAPFIPGILDKFECWLDEFELSARHWAVFDDSEIIAAARMSIHDCLHDVPDAESFVSVFKEEPPSPIASFNRLVVDAGFRGRGLSTLLDKIRIQAAVAAGCRCCIGSTPSGAHRLKQLVEVGFETVGCPILEPVDSIFTGLCSQTILLRLPRPTLEMKGPGTIDDAR